MFKKLKEKITEEVKSSPQRFQQLTQSVSDRLQNSSTSDDNFYSIAEDDAASPNASADHGFSSVNLVSPAEPRFRRNSSSSMASDVSFLPRYESGSMYHLQSDLDISASELEDNASTASQIGHLSKEQIFSAFQKAQMRYHKYRGRYTDLARHYKELERENAKMKSVLVETQDKAIRRVTELKEQCSLEQKAKAHLESALRDELDEKQIKIQTLKTKIDLLQNDKSETLVEVNNKDEKSSEDLDNLTKYLNEARKEIEALNKRIQEQKAASIIFQSKENDYKLKISNLERQISNFGDLEKDSNLKLAEAKMELHNELISKDNEISRLKKDIEGCRIQLDNLENSNSNSKLENLQIQNKKLIDKLENLTQKNNNLESELFKVEKYKIEIQGLNEDNSKLRKNIENLKMGIQSCKDNLKKLSDEKIALIESVTNDKKEYEIQLENLRDSAKKGLISLESRIREKIFKEYSQKEGKLKEEFTEKIKEITLNNHTAKEIQMKLLESDDKLRKTSEELILANEKLKNRDEQYRNLEKNHLELIEEGNRLRIDFKNLERELELKNQQLQSTVDILHEKIDGLEQMTKQKENENIVLSKEMLRLEKNNREISQQLRIFEERSEMIELESNECRLLEMKLKKIEEDKKLLVESFENERKVFNDILRDNKELKLREEEIITLKQSIKAMEKEIVELNEDLHKKGEAVVDLGKIKHSLEHEVTKLKESVRISEEKEEGVELDKTECHLLQIKVQKLEQEHENLLKSFEMERKNFDEHFQKHKHEFVSETENIKQEKDKENMELAQENLKLKKSNEEMNRKLRLLEERHELIELEKNESKLLELKVEKLREEKRSLLEEFEMERKMFNEILENNKELKIKEEKIHILIESNRNLEEKVCGLNETVKKHENDNLELQKIKLNLEKEVTKLSENIRILEEKGEMLEMNPNECSLLEMKLQTMENEKENIVKNFEFERNNFQQVFNKVSHYEERIHNLNSEVDNLTFKLKQENEKCQEATNENQTNLKKIHDFTNRIQSLTQNNETLKKEVENKESQMRELSKTIDKLSLDIDKQSSEFNKLLERSKMLDEVVVKIQNESAENLKKEKERQNEVNLKLKELENELELKKTELSELNSNFTELETQNKELKTKLGEHDALEGSIKLAGNEKQAIEQELVKLKVGFKVVTEEKRLVEHEKDELLNNVKMLTEDLKKVHEENNNFQVSLQKLGEFEQSSVNLKNHNEILKKESEKLSNEISELQLRISQLSSDNKNISEEHQRLISNLEEVKIRNDYLEKETKENSELKIVIEELRKKMSALENSDLEKIQQDFYEIKEKCDSLFVENKNLKDEYSKLEEKCNDFSKVKTNLENQVKELENQYSEIQHEKQLLLDEVQELKIPQLSSENKEDLEIAEQEKTFPSNADQYAKEMNVLREKLTQYKSLDITNKSSIEFYEGELQKMKNKNEKLNRKLDETLVTLNHCAELSSSTEIEYLRNVLYNYMLGKESIVLARVIAAVCKFDPHQTEIVLQKEQQKQTLLGQLGLI